MSERGVFGVARGIWDHPILTGRAPFSRREAFMWLVSEAAWKPRRVRLGRTTITLARGQLAHSIRFMADAWRWEKTKVERFLDDLKTETMIATDASSGQTVTTICNYDKYQVVGLPVSDPNATPPATDARQTRDTSATNKKNLNIKEVSSGGGERAAVMNPLAFDLASELATICGFSDPTNWPAGWCGAPMWVSKCLAEGWFPQLMRDATLAEVKRKRDGPIEHFRYLEKPLARAHARHMAPLPKVSIEPETIHARQSTRGNIIPAADRLAENIGGIFGERQVCGGPGADHVRLLPDRGRERPGDVHGGDSGGAGGISPGGDPRGDGPEDGPAAKIKMVASGR
jgi:hypothetical protein